MMLKMVEKPKQRVKDEVGIGNKVRLGVHSTLQVLCHMYILHILLTYSCGQPLIFLFYILNPPTCKTLTPFFVDLIDYVQNAVC